MRRSIITTAALAAWLAFAGSASAAPFTGPWDSAHQPTTVTNPNVTSALPTVLDSADLGACGPQPRTTAVVTFSDPSGWASETFTSTTVIEGLYYCLAATETQSGNIDFTLASYDGLGEVIFTPVTTTNNASAPFVWTVSNASGVIAQEADTWIYHTAQTTSFTVDEDKDGIDEFINICINGDHPIYSHNGGDLYCTVTNTTPAGTSVSPGGWPAPPKPPPPTPTITADLTHVTTQTTGTFGFTDSQTGVKFECRADSYPFASCRSPLTVEEPLGVVDLKPGAHTFYVHAVDAAGRKSPDASYSWTIVKPPSVIHPATPRIVGHPAKTTTKRKATLKFTESTKAASFQYRLDHQRTRSYRGQGRRHVYTVDISKLAPGHHTFSVRATLGRQASRTTAFTWTVKR